MNEAELERLAESDLDGLFPLKGRLRDAAEYCRDRGETTGDARYFSLGETLGYITGFLDDYGAMEAGTFERLNYALTRDLGGILRAETAETGALLGRTLREEVLVALRDDRLARGE